MTEKEKEVQEEQQQQVDDVDKNYIETIKKLKEGSVSKEEYEKVVKQNKDLLENIVNGKSLPDIPKEEPLTQQTINEHAKYLFAENAETNNLDYWKHALKYRKAVMAVYGEKADPFVPYKRDTVADADVYEKAQNVANKVEELIAEVGDNSTAFTIGLQRIMVDPSIGLSKKINGR